MTEADPENAMGWFSLGNVYKDAERHEDAARVYEKCIELDPTYSRAYQHLGQVLLALDRNDEAGHLLTTGYTIAAEKGDVMPQKAMGSLLEKIGQPVPKVETSAPQVEVTGDQIIDRRTGQAGNRMQRPPMKGPIGQFIADHYSQETWREWIGQGTKVINELRLDFSNEAHQQTYDQQMLEWLGFTEDEARAYVKQKEGAGAE